MVAYQKPYLTTAQQIDRLQSRGMGISDIEKAERYLSHIGYYRLSAYWFPCRKTHESGRKRKDQFNSSTQFSDVVDLYVFDKRLRLLLLDAIERVEISVRTTVALTVGLIDPWSYLDPTIYRPRFVRRRGAPPVSDFDKWKDRLSSQLGISKEDFVAHFSQEYPDSELPIWIAVELWDLGMLSKLLSGLDHQHIKKISTTYAIQRPDVFVAWIRTLNVARNVCAHHARLWNRRNMFEVKRVPEIELPSLFHLTRPELDRQKPYATLAIMQHFLKQISPDSSWCKKLIALVDTFPETAHFHIRDAGFPEDWASLPLWSDA